MTREAYLEAVLARAVILLIGAVAQEDFGRVTEIRLDMQAVAEGEPQPYRLMPLDPKVQVEVEA